MATDSNLLHQGTTAIGISLQGVEEAPCILIESATSQLSLHSTVAVVGVVMSASGYF